VFSVLEQGVDEEAIQAFVATYDLDPWVGEARDRERGRERKRERERGREGEREHWSAQIQHRFNRF
jgi:SOS response regulatory protein OraA/RecX